MIKRIEFMSRKKFGFYLNFDSRKKAVLSIKMKNKICGKQIDL